MSVAVPVVLVALLLLVWGWLQWSRGPWKVLSAIDPDPQVNFDQLLFLDEQRGFAFAHSRPETADAMPDASGRLRADEAWVYSTTDGGLRWQKKEHLGRGYIIDANKIPGGAILLVQRYLDEDDNWKADVRVSKDDGGSWRKVVVNWDVVGQQFLDDARGFLWGNGPRSSWVNAKGVMVTAQPSALYYTDNGAETWERIDLPPDVRLQAYRPALHPDGSLFYLHESKLFHLTRQPDRRWREESDALPLSLTGQMIYANTYGDDHTVWIIGHEPSTEDRDIVQARLLRWDGPGKIELVPGLSFPKGFMADVMYKYDSIMTIIGADYSGRSIFASVALFRSEDGGKSWRSEKPAIRAKARPVAFWGPHHMWVVGTSNRLQHRE